MKFNPQTHHRRSIRLDSYDYAQAGAYFVTICAGQRECLFGEVAEGEWKTSSSQVPPPTHSTRTTNMTANCSPIRDHPRLSV